VQTLDCKSRPGGRYYRLGKGSGWDEMSLQHAAHIMNQNNLSFSVFGFFTFSHLLSVPLLRISHNVRHTQDPLYETTVKAFETHVKCCSPQAMRARGASRTTAALPLRCCMALNCNDFPHQVYHYFMTE
jgi:hypothetical protein